jgi:hypothetical protein
MLLVSNNNGQINMQIELRKQNAEDFLYTCCSINIKFWNVVQPFEAQ